MCYQPPLSHRWQKSMKVTLFMHVKHLDTYFPESWTTNCSNRVTEVLLKLQNVSLKTELFVVYFVSRFIQLCHRQVIVLTEFEHTCSVACSSVILFTVSGF